MSPFEDFTKQAITPEAQAELAAVKAAEEAQKPKQKKLNWHVNKNKINALLNHANLFTLNQLITLTRVPTIYLVQT